MAPPLPNLILAGSAFCFRKDRSPSTRPGSSCGPEMPTLTLSRFSLSSEVVIQVSTVTFHAASGWSAELPLWNSSTTLVLAFGAPAFVDEPGVWKELVEQYPDSVISGCSTAGEIEGATVSDDSVVVAVAQFDSTKLRSAHVGIESASESSEAGRQLGAELQAPDLRAVIVLSEGLGVNGTDLVHGLNEVLGDNVIVTGGLAGDGDRFGSTWVLVDGEPRTKEISAVGLYGDAVEVGYGFKGGWDIFGPERLVTRSVGNVLYELDSMPALDLYEQYLGDRAAELPASGLLFPLALREPGADGQLVRTILAVDQVARSMTFAGDVPEGVFAQLMKANFDRLIEGAESAALAAGNLGVGEGPVLSIAISCVGRRLVLGERIEEEVEATLGALPPGTRQIGFYSYGELSPGGLGNCELHNQTMTLTTIGERTLG